MLVGHFGEVALISRGVRTATVTALTSTDLLVLDVPLLASSPLRDECDVLIFVDAELSVREERVKRSARRA